MAAPAIISTAIPLCVPRFIKPRGAGFLFVRTSWPAPVCIPTDVINVAPRRGRVLRGFRIVQQFSIGCFYCIPPLARRVVGCLAVFSTLIAVTGRVFSCCFTYTKYLASLVYAYRLIRPIRVCSRCNCLRFERFYVPIARHFRNPV